MIGRGGGWKLVGGSNGRPMPAFVGAALCLSLSHDPRLTPIRDPPQRRPVDSRLFVWCFVFYHSSREVLMGPKHIVSNVDSMLALCCCSCWLISPGLRLHSARGRVTKAAVRGSGDISAPSVLRRCGRPSTCALRPISRQHEPPPHTEGVVVVRRSRRLARPTSAGLLRVHCAG